MSALSDPMPAQPRLLGRRIGDPGLRLADAAAGLGMVGYGGLLGLRTLHES